LIVKDKEPVSDVATSVGSRPINASRIPQTNETDGDEEDVPVP